MTSSTSTSSQLRGQVLRDARSRLDDAVATATAPADLLDVALATPGAEAAFADAVDLVGALLLRWHARLSAEVERGLAREPRDLPGTVVHAWAETARQLPGLRALVEAELAHPSSEPLLALLERARRRERARLAWAAGLAAGEGPAAVAAGARLQRAARRLCPDGSPSLGRRLRVLLAS